MANTYSQLSVQTIFAVKGRENLIIDPWRNKLHQYICGILRKYATPLAVGGWKDHVHIFFGPPPDITVAEIVQKVKASSSKWINEQRLVRGKFQWQEGYAAFSYSRNQRHFVINYIMNQEEHHRTKSFQEEYFEMLRDFDIAFDKKYVFEFYEETVVPTGL